MTSKKKLRLRRLYTLVQLIGDGEHATPLALMHRLGISKSQLHRDLKELRHLGLDTYFDRKENKYVLNCNPSDIARSLSASEQLALVISLVQLGEAKDPYILRQSRKAARKILRNAGSHQPDFLEKTLRLPQTSKGYGCKPDILENIHKALQEKQRVIILYSKPGEDAEEYEINPYQIYMYSGSPYIDAFTWKRNQIRCFKISRIHEVTFTGLTFSHYRDYDFHVHHWDSFGMFSNREPEWVTVWFSNLVAPYICEELVHHSQEITKNRDNSILYSVCVSEPREVLKWVLRWGENGEVLRPSWLRELARKKVRAMLSIYERDMVKE